MVQTVNHGFALGNNLGLVHAHGATVVFLNNDTEVEAGWLAPLVRSLADPEVLGAQSLLIYPDGTSSPPGSCSPGVTGCRTCCSSTSRWRTPPAWRESSSFPH